MECYNDFASIYDELIEEDIDYERWAGKIIEMCGEYDVCRKNYLDLACGTGNFTAHIGKNFIFTTAVDLSPAMLSVADEKLKEEGVRAKVLCQDISNLKIDKKFDLITCGLDSTNYLTEDGQVERYLKNVSAHLNEGGIFVFDVNSEYKIKNVLGNNTYNYDCDDVVYIWENSLCGDVVTMDLTFFVKKGQVYERFDETHVERAYSDSDIEKYVEAAGMKVVKKLNAYTDEAIDDKTERITYVCMKGRE